MNQSTALILFTFNYPFTTKDLLTEKSFLQVEIQYLAEAFHPLIIAPNQIFEEQVELPVGVEVDTSYSKAVMPAQAKRRLLNLFRSSIFYHEVLNHPEHWLKPRIIRDLAVRALYILATHDWVVNLLRKHKGLNPANTIFYTYWLNNITMGIGMAKQEYPDIRLVSRAHRGDLYTHNRPYDYFTYRPQTLRLLDRLFLISDHGMDYISNIYPWISNHCEVSRLGIRDSGVLTTGSKDRSFRIVSCSSLTFVKRVDLLISGIAQAALERPGQQFEWNHFGGGPLMEEIKSLASQTMPPNVSWVLHGNLPNEEIFEYYKQNPVDLFINVSSSEGIPVSIMEAACFGIPILATSVGGTPEIVSPANGRLLSSETSTLEIANAILVFIDDPALRIRAATGSRQVWQSLYDADHNYPEFINRLKSVRADG